MRWAVSICSVSSGTTVIEQAGPSTPRRSSVASYGLVLVMGAWALAMTLGHRSPPAVACDATQRPAADTVVMLSASWCGYCRAARRFLQDENIKHCEYDIESDAEGRRRFAAQSVKVIPILTLGEETFVGFEREQLVQALVAKGLRALGE
jgi:mycoredoxin